MRRYISNPTEIEAIQWNGSNGLEMDRWINTPELRQFSKMEFGTARIFVKANNEWLVIERGEWVLKDEIGFYPCKDKIFKKKYRAVGESIVDKSVLVYDEDTMDKVATALKAYLLDCSELVVIYEDLSTAAISENVADEYATQLISAMQNAGIKFREVAQNG